MRNVRIPIFFLAALAAGAVGARVIVACNTGDTKDQNPAPYDSGVIDGGAFNINVLSHIVVIYQENWSFDGLYGDLPGVEHTPFCKNVTQTDVDGNPLPTPAPGTPPQQVYNQIPIPLNSTSLSHGAVNPDYTNFDNWYGTGDAGPTAPNGIKFFSLDAYNPQTAFDGDLQHTFYLEQLQIDYPDFPADQHPGKLDGFLAWSTNPGLVLSGRNTTELAEQEQAQLYTVFDHCFHSAFGGSFLNHQFLVAGAPPVWTNAGAGTVYPSATDPTQPGDAVKFLSSAYAPGWVTPQYLVTQGGASPTMEADGGVIPGAYSLVTMGTSIPAPASWAAAIGSPVDWAAVINPAAIAAGDAGAVSVKNPDSNLTRTPEPDGYYRVINTSQPSYWPFAPYGPFVPPLTNKHIGDLLSAQTPSVSWKWYSQGWNQAVEGNPDPLFQYHHQPFNYFKNLAPGTPGRVAHLGDYTDLEQDLAQGTLPAVSFVKFQGEYNSHPGYAQIVQGSKAVAALITLIQKSTAWPTTAIFLTYDEHGGRWDHVAPPTGCTNGNPGSLNTTGDNVAARFCDSKGNDPEVDLYGHSYGPGLRVPLVVISPYANANAKHVDTTPVETDSILKFIERRFTGGATIASLTSPQVPTRDATSSLGDLTSAFTGTPILTVPVFDAGPPDAAPPPAPICN